ncbi:hypothetical protein ACI65C_004116 [Semiaphis heraclei]
MCTISLRPGVEQWNGDIVTPAYGQSGSHIKRVNQKGSCKKPNHGQNELARIQSIVMMSIKKFVEMAKNGAFPKFLPSDKTGQNVRKNITETFTPGIIKTARQTEAVDNMIPTQSDQKFDDLPEISDSDIEEVIRSVQENEDTITDKAKVFNVDSLLNDPYTL